MIVEILELLEQVDVNVNFSKSGNMFIVSIRPLPKSDDPAVKKLVPFLVKGENMFEVQEKVLSSLKETLPSLNSLTDSMNKYLDSMKQMEAESKMKEEAKKKEKEKNDKITKKFHDFDALLKENKLDEAKKVIDSAEKIDPGHHLVVKGKKNYLEAKAKESGDLFSSTASETVNSYNQQKPSICITEQKSFIDEDQIEAIIEERNQKFNSHGRSTSF